MVLLTGLAVAAVSDFRTGKIPNALTFPMMALGIAIHAATGADPLFGVVGCAAAFVMHFPLYALGIEKAGDAKLLMGLGACVGWHEMLDATLWLAVVYFPVGLALLATQGKLGNFVATARWLLARAGGAEAGEKPEPTYVRAGPIVMVAGVLGWATDWLGRYL